MNIKEIFHRNNFLHKIKLNTSENEFILFQNEETNIEENEKDKLFSLNEWNQEYELIYLSYAIDR